MRLRGAGWPRPIRKGEMCLVAFASTDRDDATLYRIMTSVIVPRPIAFIATRYADGHANLAPFSFFNMVTATPPTLAVSIGSRRGRPKDSAANILATGDFVDRKSKRLNSSH